MARVHGQAALEGKGGLARVAAVQGGAAEQIVVVRLAGMRLQLRQQQVIGGLGLALVEQLLRLGEHCVGRQGRQGKGKDKGKGKRRARGQRSHKGFLERGGQRQY